MYPTLKDASILVNKNGKLALSAAFSGASVALARSCGDEDTVTRCPLPKGHRSTRLGVNPCSGT